MITQTLEPEERRNVGGRNLCRQPETPFGAPRPRYSSAGCFPAESASASPGKHNLSQGLARFHDSDTTAMPQKIQHPEPSPQDAVRFSRRELRGAIHWSDFQIRKHIGRLVELEFVLAHRGRNGRSYVYELLYSGEAGEGVPFLMGLADPASLRESTLTMPTLSPFPPDLEPPLSPP